MKFYLKITLYILCLLAMLSGIVGSVLVSISFDTSLAREKKSAREAHQMLLNTLQVVNRIESWKDSQDVSHVLTQLLTENASSWSALRIASPAGSIYEVGSAEEFAPVLPEDIPPQYCMMSRGTTAQGEQYLQLTGSFAVGRETLQIDALYDISGIYAMRAEQQIGYQKIYICMVVTCMIVAGAVLTYSISWHLTRPLSTLTRASKAIAAGDLTYRSRIRTNDEFGALSSEFDYMASQLEKNVAQLREAKEQQERFTRNFTHELKTPMASIIGYSDLIRRQALTPEEQAEAANYIFTEGKRLENLSIKLLEIFLTDQQEIALQKTYLAPLLERIVVSYRARLEGTSIKIQSSCTEGSCNLDPDLVWSLVTNLLDNAYKALEPGGRIAVVGEITSTGCQITVMDNGRGIPPEDIEHITEAFYRSNSRPTPQRGAGLGLALCARIVELHHGTMGFKSRVGKGTHVTIKLKGGAS